MDAVVRVQAGIGLRIFIYRNRLLIKPIPDLLLHINNSAAAMTVFAISTRRRLRVMASVRSAW